MPNKMFSPFGFFPKKKRNPVPPENGIMFLPDFTDYVTDGFTAYASSELAAFPAWEALNLIQNTSDYWISGAGAVTEILGAKCDQLYPVYKYTIRAMSSASVVSRMPKDFLFQGTVNGVDFVTLDTITGETGWVADELREFRPANVGLYNEYRLLITANNGNSYYSLGTLALYS
jgi:hypothetical protein